MRLIAIAIISILLTACSGGEPFQHISSAPQDGTIVEIKIDAGYKPRYGLTIASTLLAVTVIL